MSIQPPSDIVLDVAQAADPTRMQAAAQKLAKLAGAGGASFAQVMDAARTGAGAAAGRAGDIVDLRQSMPTVATRAGGKANPYVGLEAAIWQTLVEDMLPKNQSFFGDSTSGDITRTLMAEQLGNQLAKTTTLGIAAQALRQHPLKETAPTAGLTPPLVPATLRRG